MATVWILLWLHVEAGMKPEAFQLGAFSSAERCATMAEQARIMEVNRSVLVQCIKVNIGSLK
jgi:hypothetical protein